MPYSNLPKRPQQLVGRAILFYQSAVQIVRGEGVYLYDDAGRKCVDMCNNVPCYARKSLSGGPPAN